MIGFKYSLKIREEKRLVITHSWFFRNIKIKVDGEEIGKIAKPKIGSKEYLFVLDDGSKLEIGLVPFHKFLHFVQLEILLNNQPIPGSPTDPHQQILEAYQAIELRMKFNLLIIFLCCFLGFLGIITGDIRDYEMFLGVMIIILPFGFIVGVIPQYFFINKIKKLSKNTLKFLIFTSIIFAVTGDGWSLWILYKIFPALGAIDKLKQAGFTEYKKPNSPQANSKTRKTPKVKPNHYKSSSPSVDTSPSTETSLKNHNFGNKNSFDSNSSNNNVYVEDIEFDIFVENDPEDLINEAIRNQMNKLNPQGYQLYKKAEIESNPENLYQAGEAYDHSYDSFWGDCIFAEKYDRHFFEKLDISAEKLGAEQAKEKAKKIMLHARESLVISCQCYLQVLSLDPQHYWANLKLATALTASLQTDASLNYWKQALKLNKMDTCRAIVADSMGFDYRSIAAKDAIHSLGLGGSSQNLSPRFLQKQLLAQKILCSNPYLAKKIPELRRK